MTAAANGAIHSWVSSLGCSSHMQETVVQEGARAERPYTVVRMPAMVNGMLAMCGVGWSLKVNSTGLVPGGGFFEEGAIFS